MLTIFTTAKPFKGHFGMIQHNALKSWSLLRPTPQIILFGSEEGSAEVAAELSITRVEDVERNESGTPLISSMFSLAQKLSPNPLLCYVNADIMLTSQFIGALCAVAAKKSQFVMTGRRTLLDVDKPWDFDRPDWEDALHRYANAQGKLDVWVGMDYFAFPRGAFPDIPPFAVGRVRWDNWMIYSARCRGVPVVNATQDVQVIHQNHDYSHLAGGAMECVNGPEGLRNKELAGTRNYFCIADSTFLLKSGRLRRALEPIYLWRRLHTLPVLYPIFAPVKWLLSIPLWITRPLRRRLGWKF